MMRTSALYFLAASALLTGACASSGQPSGQVDPSRDLAEMKERILELQEQAAVTEVEMARLRAQVSSLEMKLDGESPDRGMSPAAGKIEPLAVEDVSPAAPDTRGVNIEETDLAPETVAPRIPSADNQQAPPLAETAPAATAPATALQPVEPAAQALYDRGYTLYHQGKYLDGEASFQRFLQAYPSTELSDNAQFWIGESRYARGDVRGALAAFREVIQKYPEGNKVPDSLIKEGDCLEKLGDRDGARDRYEEVRRRFPDSGAAVMAEDRMAGLDG